MLWQTREYKRVQILANLFWLNWTAIIAKLPEQRDNPKSKPAHRLITLHYNNTLHFKETEYSVNWHKLDSLYWNCYDSISSIHSFLHDSLVRIAEILQPKECHPHLHFSCYSHLHRRRLHHHHHKPPLSTLREKQTYDVNSWTAFHIWSIPCSTSPIVCLPCRSLHTDDI